MAHFILKIDKDRYLHGRPPREVWPTSIEVEGTQEQAEFVAATLSCEEAGCTDFWVVEEKENV